MNPEQPTYPEMLEEDFAEMIGQIPGLQEMLQEWQARLSEFEKDPEINADAIETLKADIEVLIEDITLREEARDFVEVE